MASQNPFLVNWVKSAYSMEMGLVPVLEQQTGQLQNDPELRKGLDQHLQKTRQHAELLRGCLQRMGENVSAIRPSDPIMGVYGRPSASGPDAVRQTELIDYVTESFEVASYRALRSLANMVGDQETSRVCEQILEDETAITNALDQRLPGHDGGRGAAGAQGQDNATLARENFAALNAHDLDRAERQFAADFRTEVPGAPGTVDREKNRAYIQTYLTAFPDLHFDVQRVIANGDDVVVEWICSGTHTGPLHNPAGDTMPAIPPSHPPDGARARQHGFSVQGREDRPDPRLVRHRRSHAAAGPDAWHRTGIAAGSWIHQAWDCAPGDTGGEP